MTLPTWSRRDLLKSVGAWGLLAPVLLAQGARAAETASPKRLVVIFSPNGPILERGPASGQERDFKLHEWWSPLERHKQRGLFFSGLHQAGVPYGEHDEWGHQSAGTGALTARTTEKTNNATGPSLDQFIGQTLQQRGILTPKRSVLWGMHTKTGHWGPWYEAAGKPISPIVSPYDALEDIMGGFSGGGGGPDPKLVRKHFMLDAAWRDCQHLVGRLGPEGRRILEFHCANIESLEKSVAASLVPTGPMCTAPTTPPIELGPETNFRQPDVRDDMMAAFTEMTALSFACDITRVVGISFGGTADRFAIPSRYDVPSSQKVDSGDSGPQHHAWTHVPGDGEEKRKALRAFTRWYSEKVALLLDKLATTPDASGAPLLESTLVLWTSELGEKSDKSAHPNTNIPVMLFGGDQSAIKTGRLFDTKNVFADKTWKRELMALPLHQMFVSIIRHMGLEDVDTFGNHGQGGLDWLAG